MFAKRLARLVLTVILLGAPAAWAERSPDLVLTGTLTGADHETYREVPFRVPRGAVRLTLEFDYTGRDQRSVIDIGLRDPQRLRGWSGGNKSRVVIEEADATPSYLPGPLPAGTWRLILGVPNIRKASRAEYTARIWFDDASAPFPGFLQAPIRSGPGWYRGDLHMHTGHSDGACRSAMGRPTPCPLFRTLEAARARGLDFVAVTDHNTASQNQDLRELAPWFDDLLLIPGREITTFHGHANVFGVTGPLEFQLGDARLPDLGRLLDAVEAAHGLIAVNHPGLPSGEACMGCGWTAATDWSRIPAIEAVNGGSLEWLGAEGPLSGLPTWETQLAAGRRITAIGGSDNHDASAPLERPGSVGGPTTVVHAPELSQAAILGAIRAGHVFVDVQGSRDRLLDVRARSGAATAEMGDALPAAAGAEVALTVTVAGVPAGSRLSPAVHAAALLAPADLSLAAGASPVALRLRADGRPRWLRIDVRGPDGKLLLLGNPVYLRP